MQANSLPTQFIVTTCNELPGIYENTIKLSMTSLLFPVGTDIEDMPDCCTMCPDQSTCLATLHLLLKLQQKSEELNMHMSTNKMGLLPELHSRIAVLKNLQYIDDQDMVTLKGRCCCLVCLFSIISSSYHFIILSLYHCIIVSSMIVIIKIITINDDV